jgi:hypothetical protein
MLVGRATDAALQHRLLISRRTSRKPISASLLSVCLTSDRVGSALGSAKLPKVQRHLPRRERPY